MISRMNTPLASEGFAERLKLARAHRALSYRALGEAAGLSHTAVQHLEAGASSPSLTNCERLAAALGVRASWLAFGDGRAPAWAVVE